MPEVEILIPLEKKFDSKSFSQNIELRVLKGGMGYMEAIVAFCDDNDMDPSAAATLVKRCEPVKAKLEAECRSLNLLEKHAALPGL